MHLCENCNKSFSDKYKLQKHLQKKNKCNTILECSRCRKTFTRKYDLNRHIERKTPCIKIKDEFKERELALEEKKIELEFLKIDSSNKEREIRLLELDKILEIEKEKTLRKQTTSKSINIDQINIDQSTNIENSINLYFVNYTEKPEKAIQSITPELSAKLLENGNAATNITKYLYNNDNFPMFKNMICIDKDSEIFECFSEDKWKRIIGFDKIERPIHINTKEAYVKIADLYIQNITDDKKSKVDEVIEEQNKVISNFHKDYKNFIIDGLPKINIDDN
jgi:hypothetical protein